jgi:hypothetical protein
VRVDGSGIADVLALPRAKTYRSLEPAGWSPDGMKLLYIIYEAQNDESTGGCRFHRSNTQLYTIGADGRGRR